MGAHPYFDELRQQNYTLPSGKQLPPLFNFTDDEVKYAKAKGIAHKVIPKYLWDKYNIDDKKKDIIKNNERGKVLIRINHCIFFFVYNFLMSVSILFFLNLLIFTNDTSSDLLLFLYLFLSFFFSSSFLQFINAN